MKSNKIKFLILTIMAFTGMLSCNNSNQNYGSEILLKDNWQLSNSTITATGAEISTPGFDAAGWYKTQVPTTVLAALEKNKVYENLYFSNNLEKVDKEQFKKGWWYRTEFDLKEVTPNVELVFEGINYRADIWINGKQVFSKDSIYGSFRIFKLNVKDFVKEGKNALAVMVEQPVKGEPTIGFVDWNPTAADKNMGLWRPVKVRLTGNVSLDDVFVKSDLDVNDFKSAKLTVTANVKNHSANEITTTVQLELEKISLKKEIKLLPNQTAEIKFDASEFEQLNIQNPRVWWPYQLGTPELYTLKMNAGNSDSETVRFGIRKVEDYMNAQGHRGYKINGKELLLRGAGWVDDLMLADDDKKVRSQFEYVKHMNLNTVRLEGFWGNSEYLYNLADEMGILLMAGWSCHWEWMDYFGTPDDDFGCIKSEHDMKLVVQYTHDHVLWLRNHPSLFLWVLGSDKLPRPEFERMYYADFDLVDRTRPILAACKMKTSEISGSTGAKMAGPYDWVSPAYWYIDTANGGAFGFNTETGPGAQPVPYESLVKMIPEKNLWPIDSIWNFHCGRNEFHTLNRFVNMFDNRYGKCSSVQEFSFKAQVANYEAMRAMFEAFSVNKPKATGVIQWMLNSAWPEFYWQLYDYYLMPNGAFYAAKNANRPLNIIYNYGNSAIYVSNDHLKSFENLTADIKVYNMDGTVKHTATQPVKIDANTSVKIYDLPQLKDLSKVYFVSLSLKGNGEPIDNFYWLSTKKDVEDWKPTTWVTTPYKEFADFKDLAKLPKSEGTVTPVIEKNNDTYNVKFTYKNTSKVPAFFIEAKIANKATGETIVPVFWSDNYITVMPGEERTITATVKAENAGNDTPVITWKGWNVN